MAVRRIRGHWWVDFRHEGVRYRKKSPAANKGGAQAYEALLRQRLARGEPLVSAAAQPVLQFAEFAERWVDDYVVSNNKPSELRAKRVMLRTHLLPELGRLRLDQITPQKIEAFKAKKLAEGLARKYVNNLLAALGRCLTIAEEWGELERRPRIRLLRLSPAPFRFLTVEQSNRLLASIRDPFWCRLVLTAVRSGLRKGELRALDWSRVDLSGRVLTVDRNYVNGVFGGPKNDRTRRVPISDDLACALGPVARESGLVFRWADETRPIGEKRMAVALKRLCVRAGVPIVGWHDLRHSFASQLVARGASMRAVQELLGHSDIRVTQRYAHLNEQHLAEAVARLDAGRFDAAEGRIPARVLSSALVFGQPVGNGGGRLPREAQKTGAFHGAAGGSRIEEDDPSEPGEGQPSSADVGRDQGTGNVAA